MRRSQEGFTLTELVVAMAILALATAAVLPYGRQSSEARQFTELSQRTAALLREARIGALSRQRETAVEIDLKARRIRLGTREIAMPDTVDATLRTARGDVSPEGAVFRFFADGSATGGTVRFTRGGDVKVIAIHWLTGAVTLEAGAVP